MARIESRLRERHRVDAHCRSAVGMAELPFNIPVESIGNVRVSRLELQSASSN